MATAFKTAKNLLTDQLGGVVTNSNTFLMHGNVTVVIFLLFFIVTFSNQFFGDSIDCIPGTPSQISREDMDLHCLLLSTFTENRPKIKDPNFKNHRLLDDALTNFDGLYYSNNNWYKDLDGLPVRRHQFYHWICFAFLLHAIVFSIPSFIWKKLGQSDLTNLVKMIDDKEKLMANLTTRNKYFRCSAIFTFCEILSLVGIIGQFIFVNYFWAGSIYGLDLIKWIWVNPSQWNVTMQIIFPYVTKCIARPFGPSGTVRIQAPVVSCASILPTTYLLWGARKWPSSFSRSILSLEGCIPEQQ